MALVWTKINNDRKYEIRTAGNSIRLYTNGVFHSQYNPKMKNCNGIWDLLVLPLFLIDPGLIKRVLVLGVGGGAAIKMVQDYFDPDEIVGVELNPVHISIAKRFFKVNQKNVLLVEAEARQWTRDYTGKGFDLIIEDLFTEVKGEPARAIEFDSSWYNLLKKHLLPTGLLVANFISAEELGDSILFKNRKNLCKQASLTAFSDRRYDNQIVSVYPRHAQQNVSRYPGPGLVATATREKLKEYIPAVMLKNFDYILCRRICK